MPQSSDDLAQVMTRAKLKSEGVSVEQLAEIDGLIGTARSDPLAIAAEVVMARRKLDAAKRNCANAARSATELQEILESLLVADPWLCRLEGLRSDGADAGGARAVCRLGGQLHELPIHPGVDIEALRGLEPWEYVLVHPEQKIVLGISRYPDQFERARGEIVEFKSYYDDKRAQAWVAREGHGDEVVKLAGRLQDLELAPAEKLVLLHDDPRWAIDRIEAERTRSRFEVPVDELDTRLEDLAGLDEIIEALLEDVAMRLLNPGLRDQFALEPLRGLLLFSYKPGMGKTALIRALACFLDELGREQGFDVVLYVVKPNELKIVWHGGDAKLVRDELCGSIRARQREPRTRPLFQLVVMDEIDSLGKRGGGMPGANGGELLSSASDDAVQALLAEMDGMVPQQAADDGPPAHVLWCGLTNRPDMLDEALKRPRRFGDFVREIPAADQEAAARILAIHGRGETIPWLIEGQVRTDLPAQELRAQITRPAVAAVFDQVVLRYATDGRAGIEVTAGEAMASVNFTEAVNLAKKKAARRKLNGVGLAAIAIDDVIDGLIEQACAAARQMDADRTMFRRQMRIEERVNRVELVPEEELATHRYVRHQPV